MFATIGPFAANIGPIAANIGGHGQCRAGQGQVVQGKIKKPENFSFGLTRAGRDI